MGRKLWLITGGAVAAAIAARFLATLAPSLEREYSRVFIAILAIWAALALLVLMPGARRRQKLVVLIAAALAVALSLATRWFGIVAFFLGYFGVFLFLGTLLVFGCLQLFRKRPNLRVFIPSFTMILMGLWGILLSGWSAKAVPPLPAQPVSTSQELTYIYSTDQSDRQTGMWLDPERDRLRLDRVKDLYRAGQITRPLDQLHAAMVYQHALCADDFQVAYQLARAAEASREVPEMHPPLSHLAFDRWQLSLGKQQTYGTQLFPVPIKRPCPPTVDSAQAK